jgi:branched-chain amino acid transport system substrate-binding protein
MPRRKLTISVVAFIFCLAVSAPSFAAELNLGFAGAVVGGHLGDYGQGNKQGIELAVKRYNEKGGYKGQKVNLIIYDTEGKPPKAVENITRLITRDKCFALLGATASGETLAVIDIAQENEVPLIVPVSTAAEVIQRHANKPKMYIYRVSLVDTYQISLILDYIQAKGFKKLALLNSTSGWGETAREDTLKQLAGRNLKLAVPPERCNDTDTDMTSQLSKFKAVNADFLLAMVYSPAAVQIVKSMEKINFKLPMSSTWGLIAPNYLALGGKEIVEGTITVSSFAPDANDKAKAFHQMVVKEYGKDFFPVCTAQGYDATNLILAALDKVGPDPKKIRDALESLDNFEGVTSIPKKPYSPKNHEAYGPKDGYLVIWRDGVPVRLQY